MGNIKLNFLGLVLLSFLAFSCKSLRLNSKQKSPNYSSPEEVAVTNEATLPSAYRSARLAVPPRVDNPSTPSLAPLPPTLSEAPTTASHSLSAPAKVASAAPLATKATPAPQRTAIPSASSGKKIMIIGDSLSSSAGSFGSGLAQHLSQNNNNVCMHSVSGSRFNHWSSNSFQSSMYGGTYRNFQNGKLEGSKDIPRKNELPDNWSLSSLLHSMPCGSEAPVDELIVQLGSNHSPTEDPVPSIQNILKLASGIKSVKFILPPRGKSSATKFRSFNDKAISYLSGLSGVSYFDSSTEPLLTFDPSKKIPFVDEDHFWGSYLEKNWLSAVKDWTDGRTTYAHADETNKDTGKARTPPKTPLIVHK